MHVLFLSLRSVCITRPANWEYLCSKDRTRTMRSVT